MKFVNKTLKKVDRYQQQKRLPGFLYAVVKKYGEDQAGYQAALLTYYGFLSLFPLLLVLTTVAALVARDNPELRSTLITSLTDFFPVLGNQLSESVNTIQKGGAALLIGLLATIYGARGVADAFRHGINSIWKVPPSRQPGFPKSALQSLAIIFVGGLGIILASVCAGIAAGFGESIIIRLLSAAINFVILFGLFLFLLNLCLPKKVKFKDTRAGALTATIGLLILQNFGTYLLANQLKDLDALYSSFAITLGLLFWIYLQAQVMYYAIEITAVRANKLWPRSITGKPLTEADERVADENQKLLALRS
jgi:YihY family inner membrane protein